MAKERASSAASKQSHEIAEAVRNVEIADTEAWRDLDSLSSNTLVDAVEVFEDEIRFDGTRFEGPINVHVTSVRQRRNAFRDISRAIRGEVGRRCTVD